MSRTIYVGNLAQQTTRADLVEAFAPFGSVAAARVVNDPQTGLSRGFGFVEMGDGADRAVAALHGARLHGRALAVRDANPRTGDRPRPGCTHRAAPVGPR